MTVETFFKSDLVFRIVPFSRSIPLLTRAIDHCPNANKAGAPQHQAFNVFWPEADMWLIRHVR